MAKREIQILGPSYADPNLHWSRQVTMNWLPVRAEVSGTLTQWQLRDAPGVKPFVRITREVDTEEGPVAIDVGPGRGIRNVEGKLFVVAAQGLYQISPTGVAIPFGTIPGVGMVSMAHNQVGLGNELLTVNGAAGYVFNTNTNILKKITDEGYPGAFIADYVDQYLVQIEPQGRFWFHSDLADAMAYNTLDRYEAEADPDRMVSLIVSHREVLVFGKDTIEPFVNTGGQTGTFERASNTVIEVGCAAKFTPRRRENSVCWLDDKRIVRRMDGYTPVRISTDAIEAAFQECSEAEINQAYAFTWESRGHKVYYITVPGRFTFGHDELTNQWHQRSTWGMKHWDVIDVAFWNGKWIALSGQSGRLYELDWDYKLDRCDPLLRQRTTGKLWDAENEVTLNNVELKFQTGGPVSVCVPFPDQPEGPSITGSAPDPILGEPYTFTYTVTAGDAPIARTVLLAGYTDIAEYGLSWNQATATISGTPTKTGSITITPRVIDTNALFDQLTDNLLIAEVSVLLVTSTNNLGDGIWSKSYSQEDPVFSGIPTSTGADIVGGVGAAYGNTFSVLTPSAGRFADSPLTEWSPSTRPTSGPLDGAIHQHAGGPVGWLATTINAGLYKAALIPGEYVAVPGSDVNEDWGGVRMVRYTGGKYYLSIGGDLASSNDLETYTLVYNRVGNDSIVEFNDICDVDGVLYACVGWNASFVTRRYQLRRSSDGGATWPDLLIDQTDSPRPLQVESNGDVVVCLGGGGLLGNAKIWTSLDDFATPLDCGVMGINDSTISESYQYSNGLQIATGSGLFFILGQQTDSELAVTYNPETETFTEPYSNQTLDSIGIVAGEPL